MKVGDTVMIKNKPEYGAGKIMRFYANQGTALVDFKKNGGLLYCDYEKLVEDSSGKDS